MASLSPVESLISERFPCPHKGCKAVLRSKVSYEIHFKYFHKVNPENASSCSPKDGHKITESEHPKVNRKECSNVRPYCCEEEECANKSDRKNTFKCYAALKQHYLNFHAKKKFSCKKCGKMFSEDAKRTRHEFDCSISFVCSCGISFKKKNGLLSHIKRTRHKIPEGVEEYLFPQCERKPLGKKAEKKQVSAIPKGTFHTPSMTFKKNGATPILPKVFPLKFHNNPSFSVVTPNSEAPLPGLDLSQLRKSRVVIEIYHPPELNKKLPVSECTARKPKLRYAKKPLPLLAPRNMDSLSVAMVKSGIAPSNVSSEITVSPAVDIQSKTSQTDGTVTHSCQDSLVPTSAGIDIQSKTSQTDWTVNNQSAQDFSCQTDEFLAWLDSESARCCPGGCEPENGLTINGQYKPSSCNFDISNGSSHDLNDTNGRTVMQHETQTDDGWLSALLHDTEPIGNDVSDAESQTNTVSYGNFGIICNANTNNNSSYTNVLQDIGCDIQTQTAFMDSVADVTTQTVSMYDMGIGNTSPLFFNFASNIQTQTEGEDFLVSNTHTQTTLQSDSDFTEFFNMETQTDSFAPSGTGIQLTAVQTQTWK